MAATERNGLCCDQSIYGVVRKLTVDEGLDRLQPPNEQLTKEVGNENKTTAHSAPVASVVQVWEVQEQGFVEVL